MKKPLHAVLQTEPRFGDKSMSLKGERQDIEPLAQETNRKGEDLFSKGDINGASDAFARALEIDSRFALAHNNLGMLSLETGDMAEALDHLAKAFELDPDDRNTVMNCAEIFKCLNRHEDAGKIYLSYLENHPNDMEISRAMAETGFSRKTEGQREQFILDWINKDDLVFDVGAHIGAKTDMFLEKGARVVCVEPQPECAEKLRKKHGNNKKVIIVEKGLAGKSGSLPFSICSSTSVISTFSDKWKTGRFADHNWNKSIKVDVASLDEMIQTYGLPKYCKIGVQGFEFQVLSGLSQSIQFISFEFTKEFLDDAHQCVLLLEKMGYKEFNYTQAENMMWINKIWTCAEILMESLNRVKDQSLWGDIYARCNAHVSAVDLESEENGHTDSNRTAIFDKATKAEPADTGEFAVLSFLSESELISPFGVLMDIGANVGEWANQAISLLPIMEIHLFEPVTKIFHELMKNLSERIKSGKIYVNNIAVGDEEKLEDFYYYEDSPTWSTFYRRLAVENEYNLAAPIILPVPVHTLDRYCNHMNISRISFMKIDVEGAELDVLRGAKELFCEDRMDFVQFEYGGTFRDAGIALEQVFQIFSQHQFLMFRISPKGLIYISRFSPDMEDYNYANFLAVNKRFKTIFLKEQPCMLDLEKLFINHGIHPRGVIHVGAHEGKEYGKYRQLGVEKILFIEANPKVYQKLEEKFAEIEDVKTVNCAISNKKGTTKLHITSMDQSSSLLPLKLHSEVYPNIKETCQITVKSTTLDALVTDIGMSPEEFNILNLDIQGAELMALQGAVSTLKHIDAVNTEVNFDELYEGCAHIDQIDDFMSDRGFARRATTTPYHASWGDALYVKKPVAAMSSLGENGRFANQVFQYAFLKIFAKKYGYQVETPRWIGQFLFGCSNPLVSRQYSMITEEDSNFLTNKPSYGSKPLLRGIDFWGYFQYHTSYYALYKDYFRSLFQPVSEIKAKLDYALNVLRSKGKIIVGMHLRRSDYGYGYYFIAPNKWYKDWLAGFWDTLEDPILFIASDESEKVVSEFSEYNPLTLKDLDIRLQELEFYADFFLLSCCDAMAISNSSFSFAAAMLNEHCRFFFRPHLPTGKLIPFDPWDSLVLFKDARTEDYELKEIALPPNVFANQGPGGNNEYFQDIKNRKSGAMKDYGSTELEKINEMFQQGCSLISSGDTDGALDILLNVHELDPDHASACHLIGMLYDAQDDMDKAMAYLDQAVRLNPCSISFNKALAGAYFFRQGSVETAMQIYLNILNAYPEDVETLLSIGDVCMAVNKPNEGAVFFKRVLEIDSRNVSAKQRLAAINKTATSTG